MSRELMPQRESVGSVVDVVDAILDKGLVINSDIMVSVVGVELLGIKIRAALASFETAARYGLEFPSGTNLELPAWQEAQVAEGDLSSVREAGRRAGSCWRSVARGVGGSAPAPRRRSSMAASLAKG